MNALTFGSWTGFLGLGLAARELQCIMAVASGLTSKEVARELGVAKDTIDKRILSASTKLGVTRRAALVAEALRLGLIAMSVASQSTNDPHGDNEDPSGVFIA